MEGYARRCINACVGNALISAEAGVFAGVAAEHGAPDRPVLLTSTGRDQGSSRRLRSVTAMPHRSHAGQILMIAGHHGGLVMGGRP